MGDFPNECVKVYIWFEKLVEIPRIGAATGHSALAVKDEYGKQAFFSWWPKGEEVGSDGYSFTPARGTSKAEGRPAPPGYGRKSADVASNPRQLSDKITMAGVPAKGVPLAEMKVASAHAKFQFYKAFDHAKVLSAVENLMQGTLTMTTGLPSKTYKEADMAQMYHVIHHNCSVTIAHTLHASDYLKLAPFDAKRYVSPLGLYEYCIALFRAIKDRKHKMPKGFDAVFKLGKEEDWDAADETLMEEVRRSALAAMGQLAKL